MRMHMTHTGNEEMERGTGRGVKERREARNLEKAPEEKTHAQRIHKPPIQSQTPQSLKQLAAIKPSRGDRAHLPIPNSPSGHCPAARASNLPLIFFPPLLLISSVT